MYSLTFPFTYYQHLRPGRGSYSCGAFIFLKCLKLKGLCLKSLPASLECLHTLTSHGSMDTKKHKNVCELSVRAGGHMVVWVLVCGWLFSPPSFLPHVPEDRTSGMLAAGLNELVLVAAHWILLPLLMSL